MNLKQIEERLAELRKMLDEPEADLESISQEVDRLIEERAKLSAKEELEERKKNIDDIFINGRVVKTFPTADVSSEHYDASSPEYRTAFLKTIARKADRFGNLIPMFGELTEVEKRAYVMTTQNTGQVVPMMTANRIVDLVKSSNALMADLIINRFLTPYEVPVHTAIEEGDAAQLDEDKAPDDEKDTFKTIQILGKDFKKGITLSENLKIQSVDAFEQWLIKHIIARLYHAANIHTYAKIDEGMVKANVITTKAGLTDNDLLKALGSVTGGDVRLYANRNTIYNYIASLKDNTGRQLFWESADNPLERGIIHGARVKEEFSLPNETIYIGAPELIEANMFEDANVVAMPQKGRMTWYDGFMKFDAGLLDPEGFAKLTITPSV